MRSLASVTTDGDDRIHLPCSAAKRNTLGRPPPAQNAQQRASVFIVAVPETGATWTEGNHGHQTGVLGVLGRSWLQVCMC